MLLPALAIAALAPARVVVMSWDGGADWVVDRLLAEGRLPNVAKMKAEGAAAEHMLAAFPSKTAVGHAAIFTGAWSDVNGITGNTVPTFPESQHNLLASRSGFSSESLTAEPLYVTAAKAGKRVAVLPATQSYPPGPHLPTVRGKDYRSFSGFEHQIVADAMHKGEDLDVPKAAWTSLPVREGPWRESTFKVGNETFYALAYNDRKDPRPGYDTLLIRQGSRELSKAKGSAVLKPKPAQDSLDAWSPAFRLDSGDAFGNTYFRLFELAEDGESMLLFQRGASGLKGIATNADLAAYTKAYGGFHNDPFAPYGAGVLGPQLYRGGDGEAEKRVVEMVRLDCEFLKRGAAFAWKSWRPDLMTLYTPMSDSAGHTWIGTLDPKSPTHSPTLARRIWPFYAQVFEAQDDWLGFVRNLVGKDTVVALVSDHGMAGVTRTFYPNFVLERARLLRRTFDGKIEIAQTKALVPPYEGFWVTVNPSSRKDGVVAPAEVSDVLEEARQALLAARDPQTGLAPVRAVHRVGDVEGLGGPAGGQLYLDLAPGYYPSGRLSDRIAEPVRSPIGDGAHGFNPAMREMHAILYLAGGPVPNRPLPPVRQIDVAPTILRLMGVEPAATVRGRAIDQALP